MKLKDHGTQGTGNVNFIELRTTQKISTSSRKLIDDPQI